MEKTAKEYLLGAREIKQGIPTWFSNESRKIRDELALIEADPHLSQQGRKAKKEQLQQAKGIELMKVAHGLHGMYHANLTKAEIVAENTIFASTKKPSDETVRRYEKAYSELKTELMLSTRPQDSLRRLNDFASGLKDTFLAERLRESFPEIIPHIVGIAGPEANSIRLELGETYSTLRKDYELPEVREAREVLEGVQLSRRDDTLFDGIVRDSALKLLGREVADNLNNTDAFFALEKYKDHKPEPYVDYEIAEANNRKKIYDSFPKSGLNEIEKRIDTLLN